MSYQIKHLLLFAHLVRKKQGQPPFLGQTDNKIRDMSILRINGLEEGQEIAAKTAIDSFLQHRYQDITKRGIIEITAPGQ